MICKVGRTYAADHPTCISCERQDATICRGRMQKRANKHGNTKVEVDGIIFDSKREAARYLHLSMLQRAGVISGLKHQVSFVLQPAVVLDGRRKPEMRYIADFVYCQDGMEVIEDSKSPHLRKHPIYRNKKHLMKSVLGLDIIEM